MFSLCQKRKNRKRCVLDVVAMKQKHILPRQRANIMFAKVAGIALCQNGGIDMIMIKNMKMPKGCNDCAFLEPEVGCRCIALGEGHPDIFRADEIIPDGFRHHECPLVDLSCKKHP